MYKLNDVKVDSDSCPLQLSTFFFFLFSNERGRSCRLANVLKYRGATRTCIQLLRVKHRLNIIRFVNERDLLIVLIDVVCAAVYFQVYVWTRCSLGFGLAIS